MLGTVLVVILILILLGGVTPINGGNWYGQGPIFGGGIGLVLVIILILLLLGRL